MSCLQSDAVTVFDARTRLLLATIPVGAAPVGIQMTPDGKRAYVANTNADLVTVFDVPARKVLATFTTGNEPDGMAPVRLIDCSGSAPRRYSTYLRSGNPRRAIQHA